MIEQPVLAITAAGCLGAAVLWGRSARRLYQAWERIRDAGTPGAAALAQSAHRRALHASMLYAAVAVVLGAAAADSRAGTAAAALLLTAPVAFTVRQRQLFASEARLAEDRSRLDRRYLEALAQEDLAPRRWAARLAPAEIPEVEQFRIGAVYEAGTGLLAGDFYDVFVPARHRLAVVIGDVTGHGIEPSITAFQTKYLLRVFLQQYRDPGQALQELNEQLADLGRADELVSLCVAVFDTSVGTVRYASAGHPAAWLWHNRDVRPLRATGPLLTLAADADYASREIALDHGDLLVLYTDGLSEARSGDQLFGEDRIAQAIRRDPTIDPGVLCRQLLTAATDFADGPLTDDVAILAVRRVEDAHEEDLR